MYTQFEETQIVEPRKYTVESSDYLNNTSADNRFLAGFAYSAVESSIVFDYELEEDWEQDYIGFMERSKVLQDLRRQ